MSNSRPTRRQFTQQIAGLGSLAAAAGVPSESRAEAPRAESLAEVLTRAVRVRYGRHLNDEQLRHIQDHIARNLLQGDLLRREGLRNSDEPSFHFTPDLS